jgi:20S proteasome alpha/beta subunit
MPEFTKTKSRVHGVSRRTLTCMCGFRADTHRDLREHLTLAERFER